MKQRNALIDVYRFVMAICIMLYHSYHLNDISSYPFKHGGQIFVEGFFLLSGYFVTKYVENHKENVRDIKKYLLDSISYTWKKYRPFLPYTFLTVFISMIVRHIIIYNDFKIEMVLKATLESLMIIRGDSNVGVLWYMTVMLPLIPVMMMIEKLLPNWLYTIMAVVASFTWYMYLQRFLDCFIPLSYFRGIAGLSLGIIAFWIDKKLKYSRDSKILIMLLNILMIVSLVSPVLMGIFNLTNERLDIVFFIIGFSLCFSPLTFKISNNRITDFCKKYSFLIYIVHLNIADLISYLGKNKFEISIGGQYCLYFLLTFVCMIILEVIVNKIMSVYKKLSKNEEVFSP